MCLRYLIHLYIDIRDYIFMQYMYIFYIYQYFYLWIYLASIHLSIFPTIYKPIHVYTCASESDMNYSSESPLKEHVHLIILFENTKDMNMYENIKTGSFIEIRNTEAENDKTKKRNSR